QTTPTETTAARTTGKKLVRTSTPDQTTPTETTAARTTGKKLVRTSTPDQTTPTETTAARTTGKKLVRTSTPDQTHGDHGCSDNWQEVGQDVDSGPDHNHVAGRPVPEKEGRARPNRTKSRESEPPVERRPVDVTTMRTTPQRTPTTAPSLAVAKLNGGVSWIPAEWRHRSDPVIPESMVERITSRRSTLRTLPALREE